MRRMCGRDKLDESGTYTRPHVHEAIDALAFGLRFHIRMPPMNSSSAIALSGLAAAQLGLQVSAHNIANLNTAGFRRQQAVQSADPSGGVSTTVRQAVQAGDALEADVVGQLEAKNAFLANLAVFRAQDRMAGSLLDTLG